MLSSLNKTLWLGAAAAAVGIVGGAFACGPRFPWQLLGYRAETVGQQIDLGWSFEISRIAPAARDGLKAVERPDWTNPQDTVPEVLTVEEQEANSGAWEAYLPNPSSPLDANQRLSRLRAARGGKDGKAAIEAGAGLPEAVLQYIAGAVEFRAHNRDTAQGYFESITRLPPERGRVRAVAAYYMLGEIYRDVDAARLAFQAARAEARAGAPDPMGLAVASFGEEARYELVEAGLSPWPVEKIAHDGPQSVTPIARAIQLYVEQAAHGSQIGLQSLRDVASEILSDDDLLRRAVASPLVRRVLVAYVVARDDFGREETPSEPAVAARLLNAVLAQAEPVAGDDLDRLAAVAYRAGRYDDAERLVKATARPLGLWVRAKLELRRGERDAAVRDWMAALSFASDNRGPRDLDEPSAIRLRGEAAVGQLSVGSYRQSLDVLFPVANTYWGDVAYIAERILTIDELKKFVDGLPAKSPPQPAKADDNSFAFTSDPVRSLQSLLARRLMREGRYREALPYFTLAASRKTSDPRVDDRAVAAHAGAYAAALETAGRAWPWQNVTRAEALFKAAVLSRAQGMVLMGTEGPPDVAAVGGTYPYGAGQESPRGWTYRPNRIEEDIVKAEPPLGPDEVSRFDASAPKPNVRFHYRIIAADQALAAADLLPQRSQAYAATLCWAAKFAFNNAFNSDDAKRADSIYQRYVKTGAYVPIKWFGRNCPDPDFDSARTFWLRRLSAWSVRVAGSVGRHPLAAVAALLFAVVLTVGTVRMRKRMQPH